MKTIIVGLGTQGRKRMAVAGGDVVATVDPMVSHAQYADLEQVPLDSFETALVCTPDQGKLKILDYLLANGKHVLVEKPLVLSSSQAFRDLATVAKERGSVCYTAYNHRFEPHIVRMKGVLDSGVLGQIYTAKLFYGNGTAADVKASPWRDSGEGVLQDLGSHLLDMVLFLFGDENREFSMWNGGTFVTGSFDHVIFGSRGLPSIQLEATLLSWKNTFNIDVLGEKGSAHVAGLCKWGPSTFTLRNRVLPSGVPNEEVETIEQSDPTWEDEYQYFKSLCQSGGDNLENDRWISSTLEQVSQSIAQAVAP